MSIKALPAGTTYEQAHAMWCENKIDSLTFDVYAIAWSQNKMCKTAKHWRTCTNLHAYNLAIELYPHCFGK